MKLLITGGAGFIGSNLVDYFLKQGYQINCLDDLSTGFEHNISHHYQNPNFTFIKDDIRDLSVCKKAVMGCDYVLHQAALGSVPRSIGDPVNTNSVNIDGFLNVLVAARDENVKRFVYAASSSTYGDSKKLPKIEEEIGKPLSPYAVTKYVNELYADVFAKTYSMQCIGLRYFNVFGKRQSPNGEYAAVIPLWVKKFINHESPMINGNGSFSRDFSYIDNIILANEKALFTSAHDILKGQIKYYKQPDENNFMLSNDIKYISEIFNIAFGGNMSLLELFSALRKNLAKYDPAILNIEPQFGPLRIGDIPHSQASILKAKTILGYIPAVSAPDGIDLVSKWYYENLS